MTIPAGPANPRFWATLDRFVATSRLVIDRPRGSRHPRLTDAIYPRDYGYLEGTTAGDGEGIDVFVGTARPLTLGAVVCTADGGKRDAELKLLLGCSEEDTAAILAFLNSVDLAAILIPRPAFDPAPADSGRA
jgi:inorganic pyrophosphatase